MQYTVSTYNYRVKLAPYYIIMKCATTLTTTISYMYYLLLHIDNTYRSYLFSDKVSLNLTRYLYSVVLNYNNY